MIAQRGKDLLIKVKNQSGSQSTDVDASSQETYITVAGLRTKGINFNTELVDVTDSESIGRWRELLSGSNVRKCSVSGSGVFKDQASDHLLHQFFFEGRTAECQLIIPDFLELEGGFTITALDYTGALDGEITFEMSLESAGPIKAAAN